jgi:hypothetical protein
MMYGQKCSNCGYALADEQIRLAIEASGYDVPCVEGEYDTASDAYDHLTFCCSDYTDEQGCQGGNDSEAASYWSYR